LDDHERVDVEPARAVYRHGDIEVVVEQVSADQWQRGVYVAGVEVFYATGPVFGGGAPAAAASALMTLMVRLASDAPMNAAVQAQVADRADDFRAVRTVLLRDPASLQVTEP
jgi:hypothetical protein